MTLSQSPLMDKLRGAAALQARPSTSALELLTGSWNRPVGLFVRQAPATAAPARPKTHGTGRARTIYLDDQAEDDLRFLMDEIRGELGQATRSEGVRRALRAARLATERQHPQPR